MGVSQAFLVLSQGPVAMGKSAPFPICFLSPTRHR
jgi:hypothetical protein